MKLSALNIAAHELRMKYRKEQPSVAIIDSPEHEQYMFNYVELALIEKQDISNENTYVADLKKLTKPGGINEILRNEKPINSLEEIFHYRNTPIPRLILITGGPGKY